MKRSTKHEKKMRWLSENEAELEAKYPGMWVAISDEGLAGVGKSVLEACEEASKHGVEDPLVAPIKGKEYQGVYLIPASLLIAP